MWVDLHHQARTGPADYTAAVHEIEQARLENASSAAVPLEQREGGAS